MTMIPGRGLCEKMILDRVMRSDTLITDGRLSETMILDDDEVTF